MLKPLPGVMSALAEEIVPQLPQIRAPLSLRRLLEGAMNELSYGEKLPQPSLLLLANCGTGQGMERGSFGYE